MDTSAGACRSPQDKLMCCHRQQQPRSWCRARPSRTRAPARNSSQPRPHRKWVFLERQWWLLRRADGTSSTTAPSAAARCTHASASRFNWFPQMIMPTHRPIRPLVRPHRSWMLNVGTANGGASPNGCSFSRQVYWNLAIRPGRLLNYLDDARPACCHLRTRIAADRASAARRTARRKPPASAFP